jgi:Na+-transporting NADH:ubiquinone oxidoreductase subunit C
MNVNTVPRTLAVAAIVAFACSAMVSGAVYMLRPIQQGYATVERNRAILAVAGRLPPGEVSDREIAARFFDIEIHVVDTASGNYVTDVDARGFDHWQSEIDSGDRETIAADSESTPPAQRPTLVPVYIVRKGEALERLVLPVHGRGMWSIIYGYVALSADLSTIADIVFFRHGETPGIGDRIQDPAWLAGWRGKRIYDERHVARIRVVKAAQGPHQVDLVSGASVTSGATGDLVRHWFGDDGYRLFLERLREREGT